MMLVVMMLVLMLVLTYYQQRLLLLLEVLLVMMLLVMVLLVMVLVLLVLELACHRDAKTRLATPDGATVATPGPTVCNLATRILEVARANVDNGVSARNDCPLSRRY